MFAFLGLKIIIVLKAGGSRVGGHIHDQRHHFSELSMVGLGMAVRDIKGQCALSG